MKKFYVSFYRALAILTKNSTVLYSHLFHMFVSSFSQGIDLDQSSEFVQKV